MTLENGGTAWQSEEDLTETYIDPDAESGEGGPYLAVHTAGRFERLSFYGNSDENLSRFSVPAGLTGQSWDMQPKTGGELKCGISATGVLLEADGSVLSASASLLAGDPEQTVDVTWYNEELTFSAVVAQKQVTGSFSLSGLPPAGVFAGWDGNTAISDLALVIEPNQPGVNFSVEMDSFRADIGTHQYGEAYGKVVDHEGDPVGGVPVDAEGTGTNTGDDGIFRLQGPAGESLPIVTLNGTLEDSLLFRLDASKDRAQVFQFPAMTFEVVDAEYAPVESAPVVVDDQTYYTDGDGTVTISPVGLGDYEVTVMDKFEAVVSVEEEGVNYRFSLGPDSTIVDWSPDPGDGIGGVKLRALDVQSGVPVRGVAATVPEQGVVSESGIDGVVKLLTTEVGSEDVTVQLATGDKRYNPSEVSIDELPDGQMAEAEVSLRRKDQVVNT